MNSERGAARAVLDAGALPPGEDLLRLEELLAERDAVSAGGLWGSSQALVLAALAQRPSASERPVLAIASSEAEADAFRDDLETFGLAARLFPARESYSTSTRSSSAHADVASVRARLQVAQALAGRAEDRPRVVVASILALLQPIPAVRDLERQFLELRTGEVLDAPGLVRRLSGSGYRREPLAESPGEVSLRGDILDLFPFAAELPIRIELFEDEIESLRTFEPSDQRSIESFEVLEVCLAADAGGIREGGGVQAAELLPHDALLVDVEPLRIEERAESLRIQSPAHERALRTFHKTRESLAQLTLQTLPGDDLSFDTRSVQELQVGMTRVAEALGQVDGRLIVLNTSDAEEQRLEALLAEQGGAPRVEMRLGSVARGFRLLARGETAPATEGAGGLVVVNHRELRGVAGARRRSRPRVQHRARAIQSFFELKPGDLVVHAVHGLARFRGLVCMERGGGEEEHLHLLFADDVSLYVPASRIDMVQRYIGSGSAGGPPLDRVGGTAFRRRKERVERGLFDLAAELIEVQAKRALRTRPGWKSDQELVSALVGSFPYQDTEDQVQADAEIARDLGSERPMDRLLCGDVGFGKTELALRAAFRVVSAGGQVALLVPTTVLAQQHYETFAERMADFPVEVAVVSRYVAPGQVRATLERTAAGEVDVLIGTHRLLSKDVSFKSLGLLVVDEEQRFGVQHKEHFKKLRASVDLLTLSATPIPRTLHMSLSGIRDISALAVPPPGRQDIETILGYSDDQDTMREALLREKNRGGQVFFLHNRVGSIEAVAERLQRLAPGCSFAVGHGQMPGRELEAVMDVFTRGEVDVLVATTIIENGLDIPSAGTILIDDADRFGLSELHQLRGRVGRGAQQSYCYLLVDRTKPLKDIARERLKALEEMNRLGAGFGISIKDLELRGAGNVLGAEQSGHIAAIGYDMFCRLLRLTIERLESGESLERDGPRQEEREAGVELELGLRAFLPESWIPGAAARLEILRNLAEIENDEEAAQAEAMLRDRFGRIPEEAANLLRVFRLKARLAPYHLIRFAWRDTVYLIQYEDRVALEQLFAPLDVELRRIRRGVAHLIVPAEHSTAENALDWIEGLLKGALERTRMRAGRPT